jgi:phytoene synthase
VHLVPAEGDVSGGRAVVRALAHRRGANFSLGFRLLPPGKRRAVYAAYAACRIPDDIVDEAGPDATAGAVAGRLDAWEAEIGATYAGTPGRPETVALAEALNRFPIPRAAFLDLVAGCRMDLERRRYATFAELERYCELVAVTIARISLAIFGVRDDRAECHGRDLAMALQLTNICRDVGEDAERGRIYLPLAELARFGVSEDDVLAGRVDSERFLALMAFECARARNFFRAANPLPELLATDARPAVRVMGGVYRRVLDRVAAAPAAAYRRRVELPPWQRWITVAAGLAGQPFVR